MRTSRVAVAAAPAVPSPSKFARPRATRGDVGETNVVVSHPGTALLDGSRRVLGIVRPHPSTPNLLKVILDDWSIAYLRIPGIPACKTNSVPDWHRGDDGPSNLPYREYFQPL